MSNKLPDPRKPHITAGDAVHLIAKCSNPEEWSEYFEKTSAGKATTVEVIYDADEVQAKFSSVINDAKGFLSQDSEIDRVIDSIAIKALLQVSKSQKDNKFLHSRILADDSPLMSDRSLVSEAFARIGAVPLSPISTGSKSAFSGKDKQQIESVMEKSDEDAVVETEQPSPEMKIETNEKEVATTKEKEPVMASEKEKEGEIVKQPSSEPKKEDQRQKKTNPATEKEKRTAIARQRSPEPKKEDPRQKLTNPATEKEKRSAIARQRSPEPKKEDPRQKLTDPATEKDKRTALARQTSPEPKKADPRQRLHEPDTTDRPKDDDSDEFCEPCRLDGEPQLRAVAREKRVARGKRFRRSGSMPNFSILQVPPPECEIIPILVDTPKKRQTIRNVHFLPKSGDTIPERAQVFDIERAERELAEKLEERRQIALRQVEMMKELRQEYRKKRSYYAQTKRSPKNEPPQRSGVSSRTDTGKTKRRRSQSPTPSLASTQKTSASVRHRSPQPSRERPVSPRRTRSRL